MVFYRKYRPQTLDDLVGQESVKQALKLEISKSKLAHAYLFCGPRGTGKTSTARILAKIVNCEKSSVVSSQSSDKNKESLKADRSDSLGPILITESLPCNKCSSCISITDGSNLDVVEMDAASNRGIEDIRALRETIKLSPVSSRKKVYIIDEVHMLSTDAFNALLKTLEEPPEHVLFILATTEVQKIPQTILSRVTKLDFKPASTEDLMEALSKIAKAEKIKIENNVLLTLAKKAQGSFRDGIKFLDLMSGFENIDQKTVEEILKTGYFEAVCSILESISNNDPSEGLKKLSAEVEAGANVRELTLTVMDVLRQIMLVKHNLGQQLVKPETGTEKFAVLEHLSSSFSITQLIHIIWCFQKCFEQGRYISIPTLPMELAIVESCGGSENSERISRFEKPDKSEDQNVRTQDLSGTQTLRSADIPSHSGSLQTNDLQKISDRWTYVLETIRAYNCSLEALLRSSKITECGERDVFIEVPYSFHQRIIESPKSRDLLESILSDILGRIIKVSTVLNQHMVQREEIANIEVAADDEIIRIAAEIFNSEPN